MDALPISTLTLAITAAMAISVVLIIRSAIPGGSSKAEAPESSDAWTCSTCGASNAAGGAECSQCGMERST